MASRLKYQRTKARRGRDGMRKDSWPRILADAENQLSWVALLYMRSPVSRSLRKSATSSMMEPFTTPRHIETNWRRANDCSTKVYGPGPKEQPRLPSSRSTTPDTSSQPVFHKQVSALAQRSPRAQSLAPHHIHHNNHRQRNSKPDTLPPRTQHQLHLQSRLPHETAD